ncbi:MAG: SdiA-regulated domain-containing protein, partial [Bacteroidota bacterium]
MKKSALFITIFISVWLISLGCEMMPNNNGVMDSVYMDYDYNKIGYKFFKPTSKFNLHYDLEEISGLAYYQPGVLVSVQDESGRLFLIDSKNGKIIRTIRFDTSGDYEGVEIIDETAYVIESNGDVFKFKMTDEKEAKTKKENTVFNSSNDVEGLGFANEYLLVACKASGDTKENKAKGKAIYRLDPKDLDVKKKEWLSFKPKDLEEFIEGRQYFKKIRQFDPSGIAIHPITKDVYIIS